VDLFFAISALSLVGFQTRVADSFEEARDMLVAQPPAVLVADIRLGAYNGLHLVLRGKQARPNMAAIVTTDWPDKVLMAEAEAMGATFLLKPAVREEFLAAIFRTLFRHDAGTPIRSPFERRHGERRAATAAAVEEERRRQTRRRDVVTFVQSTLASTTQQFAG
jgi:DNA-binding NtrC family response regulator